MTNTPAPSPSPTPTPPPSRHWWQVRRVWGGVCAVAGAVVLAEASIPILTVGGAIVLTTHGVGAGLTFIGTYVFGWGQGRAEQRKADQVSVEVKRNQMPSEAP